MNNPEATPVDPRFVGFHWDLETDIDLVEPIENEVTRRMSEFGWDIEEIRDFVVGVREATINAIAHGNLAIKEKGEDEDWAQASKRIQQSNPTNKKVTIDVDINSETATVTITDEGEGFDWEGILNKEIDPTDLESLLKSSGRGMQISKAYVDEMIYSNGGRKVTLIKNRSAKEKKSTKAS